MSITEVRVIKLIVLNNMKKKTIKAWALIHPEMKGKIEYEAYFAGGDCCCAPEPESLAIYDKKHIAEGVQKAYSYYDIIPCTISYQLTNKKKL